MLWCRRDVTLLTRRISLVFTTAPDEASWAARVTSFKEDGSCCPSRHVDGAAPRHVYATGAVGVAKLSLTSSASAAVSCLCLDSLMMWQGGKKKKNMQRRIEKQSPRSAEPSRFAYYTSCELIQAIVSARVRSLSFVFMLRAARLVGKTVKRVKKHVSAHWSPLYSYKN